MLSEILSLPSIQVVGDCVCRKILLEYLVRLIFWGNIAPSGGAMRETSKDYTNKLVAEQY